MTLKPMTKQEMLDELDRTRKLLGLTKNKEENKETIKEFLKKYGSFLEED